jgi:hypothetical protein
MGAEGYEAEGYEAEGRGRKVVSGRIFRTSSPGSRRTFIRPNLHRRERSSGRPGASAGDSRVSSYEKPTRPSAPGARQKHEIRKMRSGKG